MFWDRLGMALSGLCIVHCLGMPFLLAGMPFLSSILPSDLHFHRWMAAGSMVIGGVSLLPGYLNHRRRLVAFLALAGLSCLLVPAVTQHDVCCHHCSQVEAASCLSQPKWWSLCLQSLTPVGGLCLTFAHFNNRCRRPCCKG